MAAMASGSSLASKEVRELAEAERLRLGHPYLGDEHLLLGVLAHGASPAATLLQDAGLTLAGARAQIARIVGEGGPLAPDDAAMLRQVGVDLTQLRAQLELTFGTRAVHEAARQVRRRPWWRGRAQRSPLCGPPYLIKRAQLIACTTAGARGETEIRPEHLLFGVLRVARDPRGVGLSRRSRREAAGLGLQLGAPHPVQVLLAGHGIDMDRLAADLLTTPTIP